MKIIILILLSIICLCCHGQPKPDTVVIAVYVSERIDTIKVETVVYKGRGKKLMYSSPGYLIYKTPVGTQNNKDFEVLGPGIMIGGLDKKKRRIKPVTP
jgi:hypothetical protein